MSGRDSGSTAAARENKRRRRPCSARCRRLGSFHALQDGSGGSAAVTVQSHAVARGDRPPCALHLAVTGAMLQLKYRLGDAVEAACRPTRLTGRHHAAPGVDGLAAFADLALRKSREIMILDHAEVVELRQNHGGI